MCWKSYERLSVPCIAVLSHVCYRYGVAVYTRCMLLPQLQVCKKKSELLESMRTMSTIELELELFGKQRPVTPHTLTVASLRATMAPQ